MKFGLRKPSLKKSLSARTKGRATRAVKKALILGYGKKGTGFLKNPKKAVYNKVYRKTTFSVSDLFKGSKKVTKGSHQNISATPQTVGPAPSGPNRPKKPWTKRWYFWAILIFVAFGAIGSIGGQPNSNSISAHAAVSAVSSLAETKDASAAQNLATSSQPSSDDAAQTAQTSQENPLPANDSSPQAQETDQATPPAADTQTSETGDSVSQGTEPEPDPEPAPDPEPEPEPEPGPSQTVVYITDTGSKYHQSGCRYLEDSQHEISLSSAIAQGYEPCKVCKPPTG